MVEFQPSKLAVRGSNPLARSSFVKGRESFSVIRNCKKDSRAEECTFNNSRVTNNAHVAQLVEHVLGKDEVTRSIRVVGSSVNDSVTLSGREWISPKLRSITN